MIISYENQNAQVNYVKKLSKAFMIQKNLLLLENTRYKSNIIWP